VQVHHATEDRLIPFAAGQELARLIPAAQFVVHKGAGHGLFERTEECMESIIAFNAECEPPASASSGDTSRRANA